MSGNSGLAWRCGAIGIAIVCLTSALLAEGWTSVYDWSGHADLAEAVATDGAGNVFVLATCVNNSNNKDVVVIKYNAAGNRSDPWVYSTGGDDVAVGLVVDDLNDRIYVAAYVDGDYCTIAFDASDPGSGVLSGWPEFYDNGDDDKPVDIALGPYGDWVVVTGVSEDDETEEDYCTVQYSSAGVENWVARFDRGAAYDDQKTDEAAAVAVDANGNAYVTGLSNNPPEENEDDFDYLTLKYSSGGSVLWQAVRDFNACDEAVDIVLSGSYVYVTGFEGEDESSITTVQYSALYGSELDNETYHSNDDIPFGMAVTPGGEVYVVGRDYDAQEGVTVVTIRYNSEFTEDWVAEIPVGVLTDIPVGVSVDEHGNAYVAHTWTRSGKDIGARRYDPEQNCIAWNPYNSGGEDQAGGLVACVDEGQPWVAVVGSQAGSGGTDIVVLRYDESVWSEGWHETVNPMPSTSSGKAVRRGGWLALHGDGMIYAAKGYKTSDFYKYDPIADTWVELADIQPGAEAKMPRQGCKGISDGDNLIYMTKGKNTLGYWQYKIDADSWTALPNVPEGWTGKKVKGGTDLVYVTINDTGFVYMLKGYKTEFWRYNTETATWESRANAPTGIKYKWSRGSWIVHDGDASIYAHKAKYYKRPWPYFHEMWKYDIPSDSWYTTSLKGMPLDGLHSGRIREKKAKDGSSGAWYDGNIYALKGGNSQQFWKYYPAGDSWLEQDTIPTNGSTGRKKRVKYGADIVSYGNGVFFALKGNKTREMWRYLLGGSSFVGWRSGAYASGKPGGGGTDDEQPLFEGYEAYRPRWNEGGTWVVYHREDDDGDLQIYASGTEGQGEVQITDVETDCEYPVFNPDGDKIAFQIDDTTSGFYQIAVVDFEEFDRDVTSAPVLPVAQVPLKSPPDAPAPLSVPVRGPSRTTSPADVPVAAPAPVSAPVCAPQAMSPPETASVLLSHLVPRSVPARDEDITLLTDNDYDHEYPEWSPTSDHICYQRDDDSGYTQIYQVPASGGDEEQFTDDEADHEIPCWLGDDYVVYVYSPNEDYDQIAMFDINGDSSAILTDEETDHAMPCPEPDGDEICFSVFDEWGMYQIGKVSTSGGDEEMLTEEDIDCENPVWSDDGSAIFCTGWRYPGTEIALVDADSGGYDAQTDSNTIRDFPDVWYDELGTASNYVVYERDGSEEEPGMDGNKPPRKKKKGTGVYLIRVDPPEHGGAQDAGQFRLALTRTVPNPSIGRVALRWQTPVMQRVSLKAFDVTGRLVRTLVNDEVAAGVYDCVWNCTDTQGRKLASGIYFLSLSAGGEEMRRKVVIAGAE